MKRSEMLKLIEDVLFETEGSWPWHQKESILEAIEKAGMRPPDFMARVATGKAYNPETDFAADTYWAKGWEPEND